MSFDHLMTQQHLLCFDDCAGTLIDCGERRVIPARHTVAGPWDLRFTLDRLDQAQQQSGRCIVVLRAEQLLYLVRESAVMLSVDRCGCSPLCIGPIVLFERVQVGHDLRVWCAESISSVMRFQYSARDRNSARILSRSSWGNARMLSRISHSLTVGCV